MHIKALLLKKNMLEFKKFMKAYSWLFVAHHPICERFQGHTISIANVRICKGCFFGYIGCCFALAFGVFFLNFNYLQYLEVMTICLLISFIKIKNKFFSFVTKIILGLALGFGILSVLSISGIFYKILLFYILANLGLSYYVIRYFRLSKICRSCGYVDKMPSCPGLTKPQPRIDCDEG
jgi:hypothetical protein